MKKQLDNKSIIKGVLKAVLFPAALAYFPGLFIFLSMASEGEKFPTQEVTFILFLGVITANVGVIFAILIVFPLVKFMEKKEYRSFWQYLILWVILSAIEYLIVIAVYDGPEKLGFIMPFTIPAFIGIAIFYSTTIRPLKVTK